VPGRTLAHARFPEFIEHIADRLNNRDYKLLCMVSRTSDPEDLRRLARAGEVDGLILLQVRLHDPRIEALRATKLPFVAIGRPSRSRGLICVDADLEEAGAMAARHLFALGHRRIGLLGGTPIFGYQRRALIGFRRAHREAGLPLHSTQLLTIGSAGGVRGALAPFLDGAAPLTALVTSTDIEAISALHVLADAGLRVPDEVAIVTLGDSALLQAVRPPITCVTFSVLDESNLAVDLLLGLLEGKPPRRHTHILPVQMLNRGSTGPVRMVRPGSGSTGILATARAGDDGGV
jgi:DNA-binding LacI/PurR family transcriptional regulator